MGDPSDLELSLDEIIKKRNIVVKKDRVRTRKPPSQQWRLGRNGPRQSHGQIKRLQRSGPLRPWNGSDWRRRTDGLPPHIHRQLKTGNLPATSVFNRVGWTTPAYIIARNRVQIAREYIARKRANYQSSITRISTPLSATRRWFRPYQNRFEYQKYLVKELQNARARLRQQMYRRAPRPNYYPRRFPQSISEANPRQLPQFITEASDYPRRFPQRIAEEDDCRTRFPQPIEDNDYRRRFLPPIAEENDYRRRFPEQFSETSDYRRRFPQSISEASDFARPLMPVKNDYIPLQTETVQNQYTTPDEDQRSVSPEGSIIHELASNHSRSQSNHNPFISSRSAPVQSHADQNPFVSRPLEQSNSFNSSQQRSSTNGFNSSLQRNSMHNSGFNSGTQYSSGFNYSSGPQRSLGPQYSSGLHYNSGYNRNQYVSSMPLTAGGSQLMP